MINIDSISEIFYNCCNIPIVATCKNFHKICKYGYNEYLNSLYPENSIKDLLTSANEEKKRILTINNNINYIILEECNVYFILGPITTNEHLNNDFIIYKPLNCMGYIEDLLSKITEDSLNYDVNFKSYNIYVKKTVEYIHKNYNKEINIDTLCEHLKINKSYFCNLFKKTTGETFSNFLNLFRVEKSKMLLANTDLPLLDVAIEVGYNNQNYYTIVFKKITNQTPSQYRKSLIKIED